MVAPAGFVYIYALSNFYLTGMTQATLVNNRVARKSAWQYINANPVPFFLFFWILLNIIQVSCMELTSDEGYYWFYAQHLQWGYYDHPPMIALMIKGSSYLFGGELGVRFFNVVFSAAGLYLFFKLLPDEAKRSGKTFLILLAAPLVHYLTFLVFPDGPLLFFSLVFLVVYKKFLKEQSFSVALLLGISMALMAWSKYHGALVVLFTVMANPRLLKSGLFYMALLVAFLLFTPHLWWQYKNDFPTFRYHLSGRTGTYSFKHVGEYLSQQLIAIGPGLIFIPFVSKAKDVFERSLLFIIIGTFAFFLVSSFKTFVHFHWTSIALFPTLYFAVLYYHRPKSEKLFRWLVLPFAVLFFMARLLLIVPIIPAMHVGEDYYHGRKAWAEDISAVAGNRPVFIPNNLREASLYSFYSGRMGVTLYTRPDKRSQYELWGYEDSLQDKEIALITKDPHPNSIILKNRMEQKIYYSNIPSFHSYYSGIGMKAAINPNKNDSVCTVLIDMTNDRVRAVRFDSTAKSELPALIYLIEQNKKIIRAEVAQQFTVVDNLMPGKSWQKTVRIPIKDLPAGDYEIFFGIRNGALPDAILSEGKPLRITD